MQNIATNAAQREENVDALFHRYLAICNQAIETHKEEFPYQQVLNFGETLMGDRPIDIAIYDDEPKAAFSLHFKDHKLQNGGHPSDVKKAWRMNLSYVRNVVAHPQDYIDHPEKLDLDWLKSRLKLS